MGEQTWWNKHELMFLAHELQRLNYKVRLIHTKERDNKDYLGLSVHKGPIYYGVVWSTLEWKEREREFNKSNE